MRKSSEQQRLHIVENTDNLLYHKGFNHMSFSDIATAAGLSKGNLYYYFKTKDEVLQAVIEYRVTHMKNMLEAWEKEFDDPLQRLKRYAQIPINEASDVIHYGCPMGSLNTELAKSQPELQQVSKRQFDVFKDWIKNQFKLLFPGRSSDKKAEEHAVHLLVLTQGLSIMSQVYADKSMITREVKKIDTWLEQVS